jgi:hypothetical protein
MRPSIGAEVDDGLRVLRPSMDAEVDAVAPSPAAKHRREGRRRAPGPAPESSTAQPGAEAGRRRGPRRCRGAPAPMASQASRLGRRRPDAASSAPSEELLGHCASEPGQTAGKGAGPGQAARHATRTHTTNPKDRRKQAVRAPLCKTRCFPPPPALNPWANGYGWRGLRSQATREIQRNVVHSAAVPEP